MKVHDIILEDSPVTTTGSRLQKLVIMSGRYQPPSHWTHADVEVAHGQVWRVLCCYQR
jgi:hypothetical protein